MKAIVNGKLVFPERIIEGNLLIDGDKIVAAGKIDVPEGAEIIDAQGFYVGPGFIDQHSHGYQSTEIGISVNNDPAAAAREHLRHGTTSYIPSSDYGDTEAIHLQMIERCRDAMDNDPDTSIVGLHLEGPFINKGYGSATDNTMDYSDEACENIFSHAEGYCLQCTYAPEMPNAKRVEERMHKYHIRPSIGHTCAGPEDVERAIANGARVLTHTFDATGNHLGIEGSYQRTQHPQECTADICLSIPGLYYELICDRNGYHVTKANMNLALRAGGEDHVVLISDAFVEPSDGLGKNLDPTSDVNYDFRGTLSGSRLTISKAVKNFIRFTGADVRVAFKCASTNSAKAMGIDRFYGSIEPGRFANIVFVDEDFNLKKVIFKGKEVKDIKD